MIKELISDLMHENLKVSQALTRAKVIANKIDNQTFLAWLNLELKGYESEDSEPLPSYRKFPCIFKATISDHFGNVNTIPIKRSDDNEPDTVTLLSNCHIFESISSIENNLQPLHGNLTIIQLPEKMTTLFRASFKLNNPQLNLLSTCQEFPTSRLQNVISMIQQKLLDTLLKLDKEFPNLENEFKMNGRQKDKAQNIVYTTIHGNNNPINLAVGKKIIQKGFRYNTSNYKELEKYGIEEREIEELKTIIHENQHDKSKLMSKAMKWLGTVASSVAAKGLTEHIPSITEFVHKIIS